MNNNLKGKNIENETIFDDLNITLLNGEGINSLFMH